MNVSKPNDPLIYAATSANLYNFTGNSDFSSHLTAVQSILDYSSMAFRELFDFSVDQLNLVDPYHVLDRLKEHPCLFISFHAGSYYMLTAALLKQGHRIVVMSDTQSIASGDFASVASLYREHYGNDCSVDLINVEEQGAIFDLIRKIRKGYITIAYIDGNKGVGGQTMNNENMVDVDLLNGKVKVRRGIAYLSILAKAPLHLALSYKENGMTYLRIYEAERASDTSDKLVYSGKVLQSVFRKFEDYLKQYCMQWANWPYVHNWTHIDIFRDRGAVPASTGPVEGRHWDFNFPRYCPLKMENSYFLFDRLGYKLLPVDRRLTGLFSYRTSVEERHIMLDHLLAHETETARELIARSILIEI